VKNILFTVLKEILSSRYQAVAWERVRLNQYFFVIRAPALRLSKGAKRLPASVKRSALFAGRPLKLAYHYIRTIINRFIFANNNSYWVVIAYHKADTKAGSANLTPTRIL